MFIKKLSLKYISIIFFLIFIDQYSKNFFINFLNSEPGMIYVVNDYINFVYAWNYGISFGMFSSYDWVSNIIFLAINIAIIIYLINIVSQINFEAQKVGITIIIGGALGNIVDRVKRGAVFDFISIHYNKEYFFPAFNIADMAINFGVIIVLFSMLINYLNKYEN